MFVCKDDGCTARYTIRFRPEGPDAAVLRFDLAPDAYCGCSVGYARNGIFAGVFDHVAIAVADLAASERFYRTVLSVLAPSRVTATPSSSSGRLESGTTVTPRDPRPCMSASERRRERPWTFWQTGIDAGYARRRRARHDLRPGLLRRLPARPDANSARRCTPSRRPVPTAVDHLWIRVRTRRVQALLRDDRPHAGCGSRDKPDHVRCPATLPPGPTLERRERSHQSVFYDGRSFSSNEIIICWPPTTRSRGPCRDHRHTERVGAGG